MSNSRKKEIDKERVFERLKIKKTTKKKMCDEICEKYGGIESITLQDSIKNGRLHPDDIVLVARYLGVSPEYLTGDADSISGNTYYDYVFGELENRAIQVRKDAAKALLELFKFEHPDFLDSESEKYILERLLNSPLFAVASESIISLWRNMMLEKKGIKTLDPRNNAILKNIEDEL